MVFEEANDAVDSERIYIAFLVKVGIIISLILRVTVNPYVPLFGGLVVHGGRKLVTHTAQYNTCTHTHTHKTHMRSRLLL